MEALDIAEVRHRTIQQDEEEAAMPSASRAAELPPVLWNNEVRARLFPQGIIASTMVVATNAVGCALVNAYVQAHQPLVLGTLLLPDQPMRSNQAVPSAPAGSDRHCILYAQPPAPEGQQQQQAPVLLLSCQYDVPEERAHAVCRALLAEVCPEHVVVVGSIAQEAFSGPGDASQEPLLFALATGPALPDVRRLQAQGRLPPTLPAGNACTGLAAAVLGYCQVRGMRAALLASVDMVPSLLPLSAPPLAAALQAATGLGGWQGALQLSPGGLASAGAVSATHL